MQRYKRECKAGRMSKVDESGSLDGGEESVLVEPIVVSPVTYVYSLKDFIS